MISLNESVAFFNFITAIFFLLEFSYLFCKVFKNISVEFFSVVW